MDGGTISNGGTIAALAGAAGRGELHPSGAVANSGGTLLASGAAELDIDGATISGGVLVTSGALAEIMVGAGAAMDSAASIAAGSLVVVSGAVALSHWAAARSSARAQSSKPLAAARSW